MAAAVPLPLAVLEAAVPLADLESELDSDLESALVVLDAAADVFVGDVLDEVVDASAWHINYLSGAILPLKLSPFFESSCLRKIKPSISLYDGGHGHAEAMERRRKNVKRIWLSRSRWIMVDGELNE